MAISVQPAAAHMVHRREGQRVERRIDTSALLTPHPPSHIHHHRNHHHQHHHHHHYQALSKFGNNLRLQMAEKDKAGAAPDASRSTTELKGAELQVGATVEVFGLTEFAQYNGRHGVIKVCPMFLCTYVDIFAC